MASSLEFMLPPSLHQSQGALRVAASPNVLDNWAKLWVVPPVRLNLRAQYAHTVAGCQLRHSFEVGDVDTGCGPGNLASLGCRPLAFSGISTRPTILYARRCSTPHHPIQVMWAYRTHVGVAHPSDNLESGGGNRPWVTHGPLSSAVRVRPLPNPRCTTKRSAGRGCSPGVALSKVWWGGRARQFLCTKINSDDLMPHK